MVKLFLLTALLLRSFCKFLVAILGAIYVGLNDPHVQT
jgi:hypothetical protein